MDVQPSLENVLYWCYMGIQSSENTNSHVRMMKILSMPDSLKKDMVFAENRLWKIEYSLRFSPALG